MYLSQTASGETSEVPAPTSAAGLYIHPRPPKGSTEKAPAIKVAIPKDCLGTSTNMSMQGRKRGHDGGSSRVAPEKTGAVAQVAHCGCRVGWETD
jgi:hypothetical protein